MSEVVDIIHSITYQVQEQELQKAVKTVQGNISGIESLTKRQIALAKRYNETAVQDQKTRERLSKIIAQNTTNLNYHKKSLEDNLMNNKALNKAMQQELGLIGAVEKKLQILKRARQTATSPQDINRYNTLIAQQQSRLTSAQGRNAPSVGGMLPKGLVGQVSGMLPAIGGALAIGNVAGQIKDVTQQFEKYRTVLRNTFQSSTKANEEFAKIKDFAAKTPYSVDELTGSFVKLVNRGFNPTKEELTNMGDIAASQGKSFDQLTEAVLDAQTGEFERLKEFGIKAKTTGDIVTLSFKGVEKQVKKTDEEGLRKAVISFGQLQGVAGGMAAQSQTLEGKLSNLSDSFDALFSNIGGNGVGVFGALIDITKEAVDWFNEFVETSPADALREEQQEVNNLVNGIILLNGQTEARSMLITELNGKYPELLKNIKLEEFSQGQLLQFLEAINRQYQKRIVLAEQTYKRDKINEKRQKAVENLANITENETSQAIIKGLGIYNDFSNEVDLTQRVKLLKRAAQNATKEQIAAINKELGREYFKLGKSSIEDFVNQIIAPSLEGGNEAFTVLQKEEEALNGAIEAQKEKDRKRFEQLKEILIKQGAYNKELDKLNDDANLKNLLNKNQIVEWNTLFPEFGKPQNQMKPSTDTGKAKGKKKTASELALEDIDKRQKIEEEKQKQGYERQLSELKKALEQKAITQEYYNHVAQEYSEENQIALLNIEKKYDAERLKYLKEAEREATKAKIANIENSVKDIQLALRSRSEKLLEEAIANAKKLDAELENLLATEEQREINAINERFDALKKSRNNLDTIKDLGIAEADLIGAEKDNDAERIKTAKKRIDLLKDTLKKETDLSVREEIERQTAILEVQNKFFEKRQSEAQKRAINAIDEYTPAEQERFNKLFNQTDDEGVNIAQAENDIKLDKLKNANAKIYNEEELSNRKRLKLEEERAKNAEEIAKRSELAKQYIIKDGLQASINEYQEQLKAIQNGELQVTEAYKKQLESELSELLKNLGLTQKQIEELFKELGSNTTKELSETTKGIFELSNAMLTAASTIVSAFEAMADREIEIRERRVEKANEIADRGNAESLQIEEEKLRQAQAQKEKFARAQMAINLAQQASALALAIAQAAATPWPANIAAIASVITAVGSGIATVMQLTADQPQGFKEGVVGLNGAGSETSDSIPAMLSRGESVVTARGTKIGDNAKILEAMNNGTAFTMPSMNVKSPNTQNIKNQQNTDTKKLEQKLDGVIEAVGNIKPSSVIFDKDGFYAMSNVIKDKTRRRNKL